VDVISKKFHCMLYKGLFTHAISQRISALRYCKILACLDYENAPERVTSKSNPFSVAKESLQKRTVKSHA
jgi:hypothetical protein